MGDSVFMIKGSSCRIVSGAVTEDGYRGDGDPVFKWMATLGSSKMGFRSWQMTCYSQWHQ